MFIRALFIYPTYLFNADYVLVNDVDAWNIPENEEKIPYYVKLIYWLFPLVIIFSINENL
jgi:hypothetical protein